jgi:hypothetical protein
MMLESNMSPEERKYTSIPLVTKSDLLALEDAVNRKVMKAMD